MDCARQLTKATFDCPIACSGLYADTKASSDDLTLGHDFNTMVEEYGRYKEEYVRNIWYDGQLYKTSYGKQFVKLFQLTIISSA